MTMLQVTGDATDQIVYSVFAPSVGMFKYDIRASKVITKLHVNAGKLFEVII